MEATTRNALQMHEQVRKNVAGLITPYSLEQLNRVPEGFNNNLIWNAGHVIATAELLTYGLAGLRTPSGKDFINRYRKGTRPEEDVDQAEVDYILKELAEGHERLVAAIDTTDWSGYQTYQTSFGVNLGSIEDAVSFNNLHEALHVGTMLALRKLV